MPNIFATNLQRQTLDKHHELSGLIENNSYDILLLTETWFTKATENLYNIQGFQKLTSNRSPSRVGGGVAIYCSSKYSAKKLDSFTSTTMSALWTLIKVPEICTPMICGVLYHPPGLRKEQRDQTTEYLNNTIPKLMNKHKTAKLMLYGDFNDLDSRALAPSLGLSQIIDFPTRNGAYLDKLFTNIDEYIKSGCEYASPEGSSDHDSVQILSAFRKPVQYETITKRVVTPAAKIKISQELENQDWQEVLNATNINQKAEIFQKIVTNIYHSHCPLRKRRKPSDKPCIETPLTLKLRRAKQRSYRTNKTAWRYLKNTLRKLLKKARRQHAQANINKIMSDSKRWWTNVKSLTSPTSTSSNVINIGGEWKSPCEFVEDLNEYYTKTSDSTTMEFPQLFHNNMRASLSTKVALGDVINRLKSLNTRKASHSEDFPQWLSKNNAHAIATPLHHIIECMLACKEFPAIWKRSEITPINKVASPDELKDFRPIALTYHCSKIAESYIVKILNVDFADSTQYAYSKGIGTTDALVRAVTTWKKAMDDKSTLAVHALFEDFSKAFDNMRPDILAKVMSSQGYNPAIIQLCISYLTDRTQCVIYKPTRVRSSERKCSVGVPQGTICGPTLWNIFIRSLETNESILKYADDLTIHTTIPKSAARTVKRGEKTTSGSTINQAAEASQNWCSQHGMTLNTTKTKHMLITLRDKIQLDEPVLINREEIQRVQQFKLLGVILDEHLNFHAHIDSIIERSQIKHYALLLLKRYGVNAHGLRNYYASIIRSLLTYACAAWYPSASKTDRDSLEGIQKRCLKTIYPHIEHYEDRLAAANLTSLQEHMTTLCVKYSQTVANDPEHRLYDLVPSKQSSTNRHSSRLRDCLITKHRTESLKNTVFYKFCN